MRYQESCGKCSRQKFLRLCTVGCCVVVSLICSPLVLAGLELRLGVSHYFVV
jgi:hypothetical protein